MADGTEALMSIAMFRQPSGESREIVIVDSGAKTRPPQPAKGSTINRLETEISFRYSSWMPIGWKVSTSTLILFSPYHFFSSPEYLYVSINMFFIIYLIDYTSLIFGGCLIA
jgi:hypothetical protein